MRSTLNVFFWSVGALALLVGGLSAKDDSVDQAAKVDYFEKKVRPILAQHCYTCHSAETKPAGDLRVDDRNGLLTGGKSGPALVPGKPAKSLLLLRVAHADVKRRMPLEGQPLGEEQIAILTAWIADGAAWPALNVPSSLGKPKPQYEKWRRDHWAWQPLRKPQPPTVSDTSWPKDDVDRFLLASLELKQLKPVGDADKLALLRRVTFDLSGLPPTPAEIEALLNDSAPTAFARVVERLLAASTFGERWGRLWLDVARYGESTGPSRDIPYPFAWRYRDYVIDAVNADVPFDQFIREQIAGDLLPASNSAERDRLLSATGFLALGVKDVNQRFKVRFVMDNVDEQIDAVSRAVLGLTVSCARCHDHKFDPIPTLDYYSLAGIFTSTDNCAGVRNKMGGGGLDYYDPSMLVTLSGPLPAIAPEQLEKAKAELAEAKMAWETIKGTPEGLAKGPNGAPKQRPYRVKYEQLQAAFDALNEPAARGHALHGVRDAKVVGDTEVRLRGEAEKMGPVVPRGFLTTFAVPGTAPVNPKQSGRLELAHWLTSPNNPLTPRVIVNRVWSHLFGQGLVSTVDNFGRTGDTPSHPELLDYLATQFVRDGWSVKTLVRRLVLTRAYQLSADSTPAHKATDPANRLCWRHTGRRLDAEELRDAMLAACGTLDPKRPAASPVKQLKMIEMRDNGPEARRLHEEADRSTRRSVYLPLVRGVVPHALEAFDPASQTLVTGQRETTTVPTQALYLLNSGLVRRQALTLAERLVQTKGATDVDLIRTAYRLTLGRTPSQAEIERVQTFLTEYTAEYGAVASSQTSEVIAPKPAPAKKERVASTNPDDVDRTPDLINEDAVRPKDARTAAWLAFAQALFSSAEFRYLN